MDTLKFYISREQKGLGQTTKEDLITIERAAQLAEELLHQSVVQPLLLEQYKEGAKWGYGEGFKAAIKGLNDMLPVIEEKMLDGNGA